MDENVIIKAISDYLKKDFNNFDTSDIICDLFDEKFDKIEQTLLHTPSYQTYRNQITQLENEIYKKISNDSSLIQLMEKYIEVVLDREELCNKLIYKYGIYNGMSLILTGTKKIDLNKFLAD